MTAKDRDNEAGTGMDNEARTTRKRTMMNKGQALVTGEQGTGGGGG
jgi:hypothetical protein